MAAAESKWRDMAFEVYRNARLELEYWKHTRNSDAVLFTEELTEAMLDLKQAVIADDSLQGVKYLRECSALLIELQRLRG